jgi:hypothetical protein
LDLDSAKYRTRLILNEFKLNETCSLNQKSVTNEWQATSKGNLNRDEASINTRNVLEFKRTYHIETKTGKMRLLGASSTRSDTRVYLKIFDKEGHISNDIELARSLNHRNPFEQGHIDHFDIGCEQTLNGIDRLELWHDQSSLGESWFVDYIAIVDNQTGEEICFPIGTFLNTENGGIKDKHLILTRSQMDPRPCRKQETHTNVQTSLTSDFNQPNKRIYLQTYRVDVQTGKSSIVHRRVE